MKRKKAAAIGIGIAGSFAVIIFLQIDAANNLDILMQDSRLVSKEDNYSLYIVSMHLTNNRFMLLNAGEIDYTIKVNDEILGSGIIKPFYLGAYESKKVDSDFKADNYVQSKYKGVLSKNEVRLTASSNYRLYMVSFEIPFSHNPTPEQIDKFMVD